MQLDPLHNFASTIKCFGYKIGLQLNNSVLVKKKKQLCHQNFKCLRGLRFRVLVDKSAQKFST